jgi:hypothetical protein
MSCATGCEIAWVAAAPLWGDATRTPAILRRPTILGYGHDDFMGELLATLAEEPARIADRVATGPARSYRERLPGEPYGAAPTVESGALKLYQPVHGWFYLVAGSLVCQRAGLPDHPVDLGAGESAGFVVRRQRNGGGELALVIDAFGEKSWVPVDAPDVLTEGEDVLPVFPVGFQESGRRRKLLAGLIPAGSQEIFFSTPIAGKDSAASDGKPVPLDALAAVQARTTGAIRMLQAPSAAPPSVDQQREISRFALLDLADFLRFNLPAVESSLQRGTPLQGKAAALAELLRRRAVDPTVDAASLADVLRTILEAPLTSAFRYNLANADHSLPCDLDAALSEALEEASPGAFALVPAPQIGQTFYIARMVYRRPQCSPLRPDVVSPPSEPFLIAPYFDPEAPSRPIRISLPIDPSIKGLRQFRKNVRIALSKALQQKTSLDKINDKVDGPNLTCSAIELSIPIITIVAMIILFVFISLLNIIFWWIPFVKICLPRIKVEA